MREALIWLSRSQTLSHVATNNRLAWSAASRFIAGETVEQAIDVVRRLNDAGMLATLDYLGENVTVREEAETACAAYINTIDHIRESGVESGISLKLTALGFDISDELTEELLRRIVEHAGTSDPKVYVRIDMEGSPYTQRTLDVFRKLRQDYERVGIVIQSYLFRSEKDIETLNSEKYKVRLCKGAYKEPPDISFKSKEDTNKNYIKLMKM